MLLFVWSADRNWRRPIYIITLSTIHRYHRKKEKKREQQRNKPPSHSLGLFIKRNNFNFAVSLKVIWIFFFRLCFCFISSLLRLAFLPVLLTLTFVSFHFVIFFFFRFAFTYVHVYLFCIRQYGGVNGGVFVTHDVNVPYTYAFDAYLKLLPLQLVCVYNVNEEKKKREVIANKPNWTLLRFQIEHRVIFLDLDTQHQLFHCVRLHFYFWLLLSVLLLLARFRTLCLTLAFFILDRDSIQCTASGTKVRRYMCFFFLLYYSYRVKRSIVEWRGDVKVKCYGMAPGIRALRINFYFCLSFANSKYDRLFRVFIY